jgi:hypothetical protein
MHISVRGVEFDSTGFFLDFSTCDSVVNFVYFICNDSVFTKSKFITT